MSWRDELRPASFRGLPFDATELSREGGQRGQTHEFPQRDEAIREELGARARSFTLRGFLVGDDYQDRRDALEANLALGGPGELVHPWRSALDVWVISYSFTESTTALGSCIVDIEFVEASPRELPLQVEESAPIAVLTSAAEAIDEASVIDDEVASVLGAGMLPPVYRSTLELAMVDQAAALAFAAGVVTDDLFEVGEPFTIGQVDAALQEAGKLRSLLRFVLAPPAASSPSAGGRFDSIASDAFSAYLTGLRLAAAMQAARLAAQRVFASRQEAGGVLDLFTAAFEVLRPSVPESAAGAVNDVQTQISDILSDSIETSPRLTAVDVEDVTPALVLSWQLYGTTDREAEIVDINAAPNPAWLVGPVKVLS